MAYLDLLFKKFGIDFDIYSSTNTVTAAYLDHGKLTQPPINNQILTSPSIYQTVSLLNHSVFVITFMFGQSDPIKPKQLHF